MSHNLVKVSALKAMRLGLEFAHNIALPALVPLAESDMIAKFEIAVLLIAVGVVSKSPLRYRYTRNESALPHTYSRPVVADVAR